MIHKLGFLFASLACETSRLAASDQGRSSTILGSAR